MKKKSKVASFRVYTFTLEWTRIDRIIITGPTDLLAFKYRVSQRKNNKKKKKTWTFFKKCYKSFIYGGSFSKFSMVVASRYPFASMVFYY